MNDGAKASLGEALDMEGERGNAFAKTVDYSQMGSLGRAKTARRQTVSWRCSPFSHRCY